jgi:hypothetical protein
MLFLWRSRAMASGRLRLKLLGFFLDLLDLDLDPAHGSPIENRQPLSPPRQR